MRTKCLFMDASSNIVNEPEDAISRIKGYLEELSERLEANAHASQPSSSSGPQGKGKAVPTQPKGAPPGKGKGSSPASDCHPYPEKGAKRGRRERSSAPDPNLRKTTVCRYWFNGVCRH